MFFVMGGDNERQTGRGRRKKAFESLKNEVVAVRPLAAARTGDIESLNIVFSDELLKFLRRIRRRKSARIDDKGRFVLFRA